MLCYLPAFVNHSYGPHCWPDLKSFSWYAFSELSSAIESVCKFKLSGLGKVLHFEREKR